MRAYRFIDWVKIGQWDQLVLATSLILEFLRYYFWIIEIFLCILNGRNICTLHPSRDIVIMRGEFLPMVAKPCFPIYFYRILQDLNSQMFDSNVLGLN
jgi:hypothetical protein